MAITPEICTHCGQAIGIDRTYIDLWQKYIELKNALVRCNTSMNIFDVKKISGNALHDMIINEEGGHQ